MNPSSLLSRREFARRTISALGVAALGIHTEARAENATRHRILCCDYQGNKVAIIAADGSIEWEFATQTPQDCWFLPNGNVLFCYQNGAKEVSREKQVVWEFTDHASFKTVNQIQVLDSPGDPATGALLR